MLKKSAPLLKQKYCKLMKQRETGVRAVLFFKYPVFALLSNVIGLEIGFSSTNQKVIFKPIISTSYTFSRALRRLHHLFFWVLIGSLDCRCPLWLAEWLECFMYLFERMKQQILSLGICLNLLKKERQVQLQITSSNFTWAKNMRTITYNLNYSTENNRLPLSCTPVSGQMYPGCWQEGRQFPFRVMLLLGYILYKSQSELLPV